MMIIITTVGSILIAGLIMYSAKAMVTHKTIA